MNSHNSASAYGICDRCASSQKLNEHGIIESHKSPDTKHVYALCEGSNQKPVPGKVTSVDGLEMFARFHYHELDTSLTLLACPFCGSLGAFTDGNRHGQSDNYTVAVACSNTSCGVRTPTHYRTRADAEKAWNRRV